MENHPRPPYNANVTLFDISTFDNSTFRHGWYNAVSNADNAPKMHPSEILPRSTQGVCALTRARTMEKYGYNVMIKIFWVLHFASSHTEFWKFSERVMFITSKLDKRVVQNQTGQKIMYYWSTTSYSVQITHLHLPLFNTNIDYRLFT